MWEHSLSFEKLKKILFFFISHPDSFPSDMQLFYSVSSNKNTDALSLIEIKVSKRTNMAQIKENILNKDYFMLQDTIKHTISMFMKHFKVHLSLQHTLLFLFTVPYYHATDTTRRSDLVTYKY